MADEVPAFDDIPSFDDLPDAPEQRSASAQSAVPKFDDIPSFDDLPDNDGRPAPESPFVTGVRKAAHAVLPTIAGSIAAGAGALAGAPAGPLGSLAGGAAGFIGGSMAGNYLQEKALHAIGFNDDPQQEVNEEANPKSSFVGELAPALATMSPVAGMKVAQRVAGGAILGGFEAGGEALHDGHVDPAKVGIAAAAGALLPSSNRVGQKLMGLGERGAQRGAQMLPGRPNRAPNPDAAQAHADVGDPRPADPDAEVDAADTALGEGATATRTGETTGNPQSAPTRSERVYSKDTQVAPDQDPLTQGDMDPATASALEHANPSPEPSPAPERPAPLQAPDQPAPQINAGFPKEGEPVAVGANEATPLPVRDVALDKLRDGSADEGEKTIRETADAPKIKKMPKLKGETPVNDSITPAQKVAGNYPKAWVQDFGKPVKIETHAGDTRRSHPDAAEPWEVKSPYDYGYFGKTKGPDGDPIDVARPKAGSPEEGDKHFIIDQKDAATGKYDEPKVFTYFKDKDAAVDAYHRGFSDGKGPERLHDITEVDRSELVKYLAKHSNRPPKGPYGEPMPKTKPLAERAVVKDAVEKLRAKGDDAGAEALLNAPPEKLAAAIEGKRVRKYGTETGASAGYPVKGILTEEGKPVTANTKAKAEARSAMHQKIADWFEASKPPSQMDPSKETPGELLTRIKNHPYPSEKGAWIPAFKPREWLLAREAKNLLAKPTPGNVEKFRAAERDLRGNEQDVYNYRHGNRIDADVAMNRKGGDEAVSKAEAKLARPHDAEDAMIEAIDRKRAGAKFDVPHEEAESTAVPRPIKTKADLKQPMPKTVDVSETPLAIDTKAISKEAMAAADRRKAEAAALVGKKAAANVPSEDRAGVVRKPSIDISDPAQMKRLIEMSEKASKRGRLSDEELNKLDLAKPAEKGSFRSEFNKAWDQFSRDESASLNIKKIKEDLTKTSDPKSYIARTPDPIKEPNADYTRSMADQFHKISQEDKSHRLDLQKDADKLMAALGRKVWGPKELLKQLQRGKSQREINKLYQQHIDEALKTIYRAREADSAHVDLPGKLTGKSNIESLSPKLKEVYDEYLAPVFQENDEFAKAIRAINPDKMGPDVENHIARITQGDTSEYNMLKDRDDPTGPQYNGLSVDASMAHERPFVALERVSDGKRFVIQNRGDGEGFSLHTNLKATRVKDPDYKFEANMPYQVKPKNGAPVDYIMRHATAKEIMENARGRDGKGLPMKYYENAALSAFMTNAQMGSMARHLQYLHDITQTPKWNELTSRNANTMKTKGYVKTILPNFEGTYMDPQLAYVLDDYAKPGFNSPEALRNLSQSVTKLLFWMPTAHIANVGAHWFVGRGFDNLNVARLYRTGSQAIKSVMSQDELQRDLRNAGAGTIFGGVATRDFIGQMGKRFGEEMESNPGKWGPIADKIGVPLKALARSVYDNSSKVMWAANDMFLTQRVLELEEKGMTRANAIMKAEKDIPNYRLPTTIGGSGEKARLFQKIMADPLITSFGRYHYGMFNSYANIVKEAMPFGKHAGTAGDVVEAAGKMLAMAALAYIAYPIMDKAYQMVTGNPDATANRRGPVSIPHHLNRAVQGKEDIMSAARSSFTVPPIWSTVLETLSNKDFRGKPVVEPGTVQKAFAGSPAAAGRMVVQGGEHLARGLVSPYSTFANAAQKNKEPGALGTLKAAGGAIRDQALDIHNPSEAARKYERQLPMHNERDDRTRFKKGGSGPMEGLYDKLFGLR